jgi:hypothetical protein
MSVSVWDRRFAPQGDELYGRIRWAGPVSYAPVIAGNPPSGGDLINSRSLGSNAIEFIAATASFSANFSIVVIRKTSSLWILKWVSAVNAVVGGQQQQAGAEAATGTNLSGEYVRLGVLVI